MSKIDSLTLISGVDVLIPEMKISIHQPTLREIAYIGELTFFQAAQTIIVDKDKFIENADDLSEEDKIVISTLTNFELFVKIILSRIETKIDVLMLFSLLFPRHKIQIEERFIILTDFETKENVIINETNFNILQEKVSEILCLDLNSEDGEFNPAGERAKEIIKKIKRGRAKAAKSNGENNKGFIARYISALGIGTNSLNILNVLDLTLYQFMNQLERYNLYASYDISIRAKLAGAEDVEDIDWYKDLEE